MTIDYTIPENLLAKEELRNAMIARAKVRGAIPYSELVDSIKAIRFDAHDPVFHQMLGDISIEEAEQGHGMLSVVVVHRNGDMQPGPGFFELASELGRDTTDILKCWVDELRKVHKYWAAH